MMKCKIYLKHEEKNFLALGGFQRHENLLNRFYSAKRFSSFLLLLNWLQICKFVFDPIHTYKPPTIFKTVL